MTTTQLDTIAQSAADTAMQAAVLYIQTQRTTFDLSALQVALRVEVKSALKTALIDAQEAVDCGMVDVAMATFRASMCLAGIAAAKKVVQ